MTSEKALQHSSYQTLNGQHEKWKLRVIYLPKRITIILERAHFLTSVVSLPKHERSMQTYFRFLNLFHLTGCKEHVSLYKVVNCFLVLKTCNKMDKHSSHSLSSTTTAYYELTFSSNNKKNCCDFNHVDRATKYLHQCQ